MKMQEIGAFEAKNRLSELLRLAEAGEEIAITNRGRVVARLVPPLPAFDAKRRGPRRRASANGARGSGSAGSESRN